MKLSKNDVGAIYRNNAGDYVRITGHNRDGLFSYSRYDTLDKALAGDEGNRLGHAYCLDENGHWDGSKTDQFALKELVEPAKCVFKVGDHVKTLRFPRDVYPHFCSSMENFVGKVGKVTEVGLNFVRVHDWNWVNSAVVPAEDERPTCLKTCLRAREIGRKFKTRDGEVSTLLGPSYNPAYPWRVTRESKYEYLVSADGRNQNGGNADFDLVERLPAGKKAEPAEPKSKFKVGDLVISHNKEMKASGRNVPAKVVECGPRELFLHFRGEESPSSLNYADGFKFCGPFVPVKLKTYPDYKKMKAGLEKIRDDSPIGSDAAQWAKDALEPEPA